MIIFSKWLADWSLDTVRFRSDESILYTIEFEVEKGVTSLGQNMPCGKIYFGNKVVVLLAVRMSGLLLYHICCGLGGISRWGIKLGHTIHISHMLYFLPSKSREHSRDGVISIVHRLKSGLIKPVHHPTSCNTAAIHNIYTIVLYFCYIH